MGLGVSLTETREPRQLLRQPHAPVIGVVQEEGEGICCAKVVDLRTPSPTPPSPLVNDKTTMATSSQEEREKTLPQSQLFLS